MSIDRPTKKRYVYETTEITYTPKDSDYEKARSERDSSNRKVQACIQRAVERFKELAKRGKQ